MNLTPLMDQKGFVRELEGASSHVEKNGVLLKWYNTCEGIGLVYHNIDPYARKDKSQKCT